ncbi:MAG: hypothetical protein HYS23_09405 [Geobacter sp.]|nr:hypothetical protein [Geobacter sp.]
MRSLWQKLEKILVAASLVALGSGCALTGRAIKGEKFVPPPVIAIAGVGEGEHYAKPPVPVVTLAGDADPKAEITLDGQPYKPGTLVGEGDHKLQVVATNSAGFDSKKSVRFVVDLTPPLVFPKNTPNGSTFNAPVVPEITVVEPNLLGVTVTVNGKPSPAGTAFSEEGTYRIEAVAEDKAGNKARASALFTIDRTPPLTFFGWGNLVRATAETTYVTGGTLINLFAQDSGLISSGVSRIEYRFDSERQWRKYEEPAIFAGVADGKHHLSFRAVDRAGNVEASHDLAVAVDMTPPATTLAVSDPAGSSDGRYIADPSARFTLQAKDTLSGIAKVEYRIDESAWQSYAPFSMQAEGEHILSFRSTDHLGNVETTRTTRVLIDSTPPETAVKPGLPRQEKEGRLIISSATQFDLVPADSGSGVAKTEYRIDGEPWRDYAPFTVAAEGAHVIGFRSTDRLGHVEPEKLLHVVVDTTPPETSMQIQAGSREAGGETYVGPSTLIKLQAIDWASDVAATEYRIDGGAMRPYAPFTVSEPGRHGVAFRSIDAMGNRETAKEKTLTVDATPPVTAFTPGIPHYEIGGFYYVNSATTLTLTPSEEPAGIARTEYRIDDGPWISYAPFTLAAEGRHRVAFRSADNLGNEEPEKVVVVNVDTTPPASTIQVGSPRIDADGKTLVSGSTQFTMTASDAFSGLERTEFRLDNGPWLVYRPFALEIEGPHVIEYRAIDKAGNQEPPRSLAVTVDPTAPITTLAAGEPKLEVAGRTVVSEKTVFTLNAADTLAGIARTEYRIDDGPWKEYAPFSVTGKGSHSVEFRSQDRLGNVEESRVSLLDLDAAPPVTALEVGAPKFRKGEALFVSDDTTFTLSAADALAGVATTEYRLDGKGWVAATSFKIPEEGRHTVAFRSIDKFGNAEREKRLDLVVDNTAPTTAITVEGKKKGKPQVVVNASDALSGVGTIQYRVDGGSWVPYESFSIASAGRHVVDFRSVDQLGNTEAEKSIGVYVGTAVPPAVTAKATTPAMQSGSTAATATTAAGKGAMPYQARFQSTQSAAQRGARMVPPNSASNAVAKLPDDPELRDSVRNQYGTTTEEIAMVRVPRYFGSQMTKEGLSDPLADTDKPVEVAASGSGGGKVSLGKVQAKDAKPKGIREENERTPSSMMLSTFQLLGVLSLMLLL